MQTPFFRLPIMLVIILVMCMYVLDSTGMGMRVSFSYQAGVSLTIFLLGLLIIGIGGHSFRKVNTTVNPLEPAKTTHLVTTGVYRYSRNPMYIGFLCWLAAFAVYLGNLFNLILLPVFIVLATKFYIVPEEQALAKLFGESFADYRKKVRRWL